MDHFGEFVVVLHLMHEDTVHAHLFHLHIFPPAFFQALHKGIDRTLHVPGTVMPSLSLSIIDPSYANFIIEANGSPLHIFRIMNNPSRMSRQPSLWLM